MEFGLDVAARVLGPEGPRSLEQAETTRPSETARESMMLGIRFMPFWTIGWAHEFPR